MNRRPAFIFFDAGLVLLSPCTARVAEIVGRITGKELSDRAVLTAYRRTIQERDRRAEHPTTFDFWTAWCHWAQIPPSAALKLAEEIAAAETDRQKLWTAVEPAAEATLVALGALGVRLGVISNADGELEDDLVQANLRTHFALCLDSVRIGVSKPDPAIFRRALEIGSVAAHDAWMIGDDFLNDIAPARECGFGAAILYDPMHIWLRNPPADIIHSLWALPHLVSRLIHCQKQIPGLAPP